jgi:hypothetical protein
MNAAWKEKSSGARLDRAIRSAKAVRADSVISNWTGLEGLLLHHDRTCSETLAVTDISNL